MLLQPLERRQHLKRFVSICRDLRLPVTQQRRAVYEAVLADDDHPTVDDVLERVHDKMPGLSRVTVYRILETLAKHGLISRASHCGGAKRYDANVSRHHHLVCTRCERTFDLDDPAFDQLKIPDTRAFGFHIADFSIHFSGVCQTCRRSSKSVRSTRERRTSTSGPSDSAIARGTARRGIQQRRL